MNKKGVIRFKNTLSHGIDKFVPLKKNQVGMYTCGPTVYWNQHIGNMRTYISSDILKRVLTYNGYNVKHVINITDVGHLVSDKDTGEDKMEIAAKRERKKASEIAKHYFKLFKQDVKKLNIIEPKVWAWATKHIKEQIELVKILEKKGYTYKTSDGIYFDTSKLKEYGKLGRTNIDELQAGKRVNMGEKMNPTDFAVWKFSKKNEKRQQQWKSPWGVGYPGWHLECSAMATKYLGKQFDIHTGGQEHIQIHHTNEIAQSETCFGKKPWVKYWVHFAWLLAHGEKISKSKGGFYTLSDLEEKGFDSLVFRYFCLTTLYRKPLNFSLEILGKSKEAYNRLKKIISDLKDDGKINKKYLEEFGKAINNDFNMPNALQALWKMIRDPKADGKFRAIKKMDEVFGLDLLKKEKKIMISKDIKELFNQRNKLRKAKEWKKADVIRDKLKKKGYIILDSGDGSKLEKVL